MTKKLLILLIASFAVVNLITKTIQANAAEAPEEESGQNATEAPNSTESSEDVNSTEDDKKHTLELLIDEIKAAVRLKNSENETTDALIPNRKVVGSDNDLSGDDDDEGILQIPNGVSQKNRFRNRRRRRRNRQRRPQRLPDTDISPEEYQEETNEPEEPIDTPNYEEPAQSEETAISENFNNPIVQTSNRRGNNRWQPNSNQRNKRGGRRRQRRRNGNSRRRGAGSRRKGAGRNSKPRPARRQSVKPNRLRVNRIRLPQKNRGRVVNRSRRNRRISVG